MGAAIAVLLMVVGAACGGDDDGGGSAAGEENASGGAGGSADSPDDVCEEDRVGGELTFAVYSEARGLDPVVVAGGGTAGMTEAIALYDTLVRYDAETGTFEPQLAESIEPNDDLTEWTLTLRPDATFGNGNPVTAEAVRYSVARHQDPANRASAYQDTLQIAGMEVVDERTLVFTLEEPWGTFPSLLADMPGMVVDPSVVDERGEAFATDPSGAGAGPYEVTTFRPGEEIVFEAKDDWWGGPVCIERLRFVDIPTEQATYDALELGEVDVAFLREPQIVAEAVDAGFDHHGELVHLGNFLMINSGLNDPVAADVRIRQAVAHAVDQSVVDERAAGGAGLPTNTIVADDSPISPGVDGPAADPDQASELVEEAKADGWDGSISLVCGDSTPDQGITLEAQLEAVGFDVELDQVPTTDLVQRVFVDHDYELACSGAGVSEASPAVRLERFFGSGNALTGFGDEGFDAALRELKAASSPGEMQVAMEDVQEVWNETVPGVSLSAVENVIAWNDRVHGLRFNQSYSFSFSRAYVTD
jgi:peptide/nickel transport system substrate-binding protein